VEVFHSGSIGQLATGHECIHLLDGKIRWVAKTPWAQIGKRDLRKGNPPGFAKQQPSMLG
jgi:hypothetical protein